MSTTSPSPACGPQADGSVNVEESLREQSGPNQETAALPQLVPLKVKDGCGRQSDGTAGLPPALEMPVRSGTYVSCQRRTLTPHCCAALNHFRWCSWFAARRAFG